MLDLLLRHNEIVSFQILGYLSYAECSTVLLLNKTTLSILSTENQPAEAEMEIAETSPSDAAATSSSHYIWMILLTKKISIDCDLTDYASLDQSIGRWKHAFLTICSLERELKALPSPGCEIQKYLRTFIGLEANSPCVGAVMRGIALLPPALTSCFSSMGTLEFTPALEMAWSVMCSVPYPEHHRLVIPKVDVEYDREFIPRYIRLLSWAVRSEDHLRVMMAQYNQLLCRMFRTKEAHPRSVDALRDLIQMRNGEFDLVRLWA
jgi:hypothetical protein